MRVAAAAAGLVVATTVACGTSHRGASSIGTAEVGDAVPPCTVKVFIAADADRRAVGHAALAVNGVTSVAFLPKGVSLARLRQKYPDMVRNLMSNPFLDAYEVTVDDLRDAEAAAARLRRAAGVKTALVPADCP